MPKPILLQFELPLADIERLDRMRGTVSREKFLLQLLRGAAGKNKPAMPAIPS